ncbi:glycoside hydrolase [uncultured Tateyamaria sp.]|uniref:glycoside hydrolase n=1 Tax=uncultured Tateyamaria sp. TaxID=455651 RepID=UPI002628F9E7|nr:glycoside hydrolase [uncultured Tateyamaria sp.]
MKTNAYLLSSLVFCMGFPGHSALAEQVTLQTGAATFDVDTDTLAVSAALIGAEQEVIALPAVAGETQGLVRDRSAAKWQIDIDGGQFSIVARAIGERVTFEIASDHLTDLAWPQVPARPSDEWALPILGEGRLFEARDQNWRTFLVDVLDDGAAGEQFSQPFWTRLDAEGSVTWRMNSPWDARLSFLDTEFALTVGIVQQFTSLNLDQPYRMTAQLGPRDPVVGARLYRAHLEEAGAFRSLNDKITARPDVALLAGAPHIYLWSGGLLAPQDVTAWRRFMRQFARKRETAMTLSAQLWEAMPDDMRADFEAAIREAKGADGFVSRYSRTHVTRAINAALLRARPFPTDTALAGGHDPVEERAHMMELRSDLFEEFEGTLASPETWGGGIGLRMLEAVAEAGISAAWLGVENWRHAIGHPEAVAEAKARGYLIGPYDSYASAHSEGAQQTWPTAQMGDTLFEHARVIGPDGSARSGFRGIGAYVNPSAVADYARSRITVVSKSVDFNSYFLDVDATGLLFEDYTAGRQTTRAAALEAVKQRLDFVTQDLSLVLGSEVGVAAFAPHIDFAHGVTTPAFDWMDPRMRRDPDPAYDVGGYWPPEAPVRFFEPTPPPPNMRKIVFDPAHRIPLYQIALGDSVVTTHHWHFSTLKPQGERMLNELIGLLYAVPPLYHLNTSVRARDLPGIARYVSDFAPLHRRLMTEQMTGFEFVSEDRLVQRTEFADGTTALANFSDHARVVPDGHKIPPFSIRIELVGHDPFVLSTAQVGAD